MDAELDRVRAVVLGIGVNLNAPARAFPPALRSLVTSVRLATGRRVDRVAFAAALCDALEAVYDRLLHQGFGALLADWNAYSCLSGRTVVVDCAGQRVEGRVRGLDAAGRLVLDGPRGEERIVAGDVSVVGGDAGRTARAGSHE
jgi:BirA family biotin operon repressor/biotin-[acetyl-CoA-carboxylase] ligase